MVSFRGRLIQQWHDAGSPPWDLNQTVEQARQIYTSLSPQEQAKAEQFGLRTADDYYCRQYVHGMRLPWLQKGGTRSPIQQPAGGIHVAPSMPDAPPLQGHQRACLRCGFVHRADARFCSECGAEMPQRNPK